MSIRREGKSCSYLGFGCFFSMTLLLGGGAVRVPRQVEANSGRSGHGGHVGAGYVHRQDGAVLGLAAPPALRQPGALPSRHDKVRQNTLRLGNFEC